jgi:photosystem II stability/assembly factor-like uncharacterized protein
MKRIYQFAGLILVLVIGLGSVAQPAPVAASTAAATGPSITIDTGAWRNMRPTESFLNGVSMLNPDAHPVDCSSNRKDQRSKGWIVGNSGVILQYCNDIWDHSITTESIPTNLNGVFAVTQTLAFAVGNDGTILKYGWDFVTKDYTWVKLPIQVSNQMLFRITVSPNGTYNGYTRYTAWAVGWNDPVYNKGTIITGDITATGALDDLGNPIYTTQWWNVTSSYNLPAVDLWFSIKSLNKNDIWAIGGNDGSTPSRPAGGVAIHWNGTTWTSYAVSTTRLYGLFFTSPSDGWAAGIGGLIFHFNGTAWSSVASPVTATLLDISFAPDGTGWATGKNGTLLKYSNGGWSKFTKLHTDFWDYYALDFTSGHGWMVGQNPYKHPSLAFENGMGGQILEFVDNYSDPYSGAVNEEAWLAVTTPTDNQLNGIKTYSDTNAWAVGAADDAGATIIHWDGKHWVRWYQNDPPLPKVDLQSVDLISPTYGWAAGDPAVTNGPAAMLKWDGHRWAPLRYNSPINVRINALSLIKVQDNGLKNFGWAAANYGNAVAKFDYGTGYWNANHTYEGWYYALRGLSVDCFDDSCGPTDLTAWAVGRLSPPPPFGREVFVKYHQISSSWYWDEVQSPPSQLACLEQPYPDPLPYDDGPIYTNLFGVRVMQNEDKTEWGFASGDYKDWATLYRYNGSTWRIIYCSGPHGWNPSRLYATDIVRQSGVGWFGGYYTLGNIKYAFLADYDASGLGVMLDIFPVNGRNIYDRPITNIDMSSDTMGWAVGEKEDTGKVSDLYQYPYPNFTITTEPAILAVRPGSQVSTTVTVNSIAAGKMNVNLDVYQAPASVLSSISNTPIDPSSESTVTFTAAPGMTEGEYNVTLRGSSTVHSGDHDLSVERLAPLTLWVTDHPVTGISPDHGPAGTVVTITGENLGNDPGAGYRSSLNNHVIIAGAQMPEASILSWSPTQIQVMIPDDPEVFPQGPTKEYVQVVTNGSSSNNNLTYQLENRITQANIVDNGGTKTITVQGTSLGKDPGAILRSTEYEHVTLDGEQIGYGNVLSWSNNEIVIQVDGGTSLNGKTVTVTSNGYDSNTITLTEENHPENGKTVYLPMIKK